MDGNHRVKSRKLQHVSKILRCWSWQLQNLLAVARKSMFRIWFHNVAICQREIMFTPSAKLMLLPLYTCFLNNYKSTTHQNEGTKLHIINRIPFLMTCNRNFVICVNKKLFNETQRYVAPSSINIAKYHGNLLSCCSFSLFTLWFSSNTLWQRSASVFSRNTSLTRNLHKAVVLLFLTSLTWPGCTEIHKVSRF